MKKYKKASLDKDTANKKEAALNAKKDEERSEYNELLSL